MFRSLDISYHQVIFAPDSVWDTMNNLAHNENVMLSQTHHPKFKTNNPLIHYANSAIKRCEESFNQLTKIESKINEFGMNYNKYTLSAAEYIKIVDNHCSSKQILGSRLFEEVEVQTQEKFNQLNNQLETYDQILAKRLFFFERQECYYNLDEVLNFDDRINEADLHGSNISLKREISNDSNVRFSKLEKRFNVILGIVPTENSQLLHKLVFRLAKENVMIKMKNMRPIVDEFVGQISLNKPKTLMFLLFQRGETNIVYEKIKRILNQFEFIEFDIPSSSKKVEIQIETVNVLTENEKILSKTRNEIRSILDNFCQNSTVIENLSFLYFVKLVFKREQNFALNYRYLDQKDGFYQLHIFVPRSQIPSLINELNSIRTEDPNFAKPKIIEIQTEDNPKFRGKLPTLFRLNDLAEPFQPIVSTYGIPRYKEINPTVFTVISFPFFFGLMFGDIGHGLIMFLAGLFLSQHASKEISSPSTILILMGFFAVFCGTVYNEFFSLPFPIISSCYQLDNKSQRLPDCVYTFGIDWIWATSKNETAFINSFKMKFSIIIGVVQMLLGTFMKALNAIHFSNYLDLFCEAIPQFILMSVTFGYMSFCIIVKWMTNWTGREKDAISIIQLFINFHRVDVALYGTAEFQQRIQITFILISLACVFIMLLIKPIVLSSKKPVHRKSVHTLLKDDESDPEHLLISNVK